MSLFGALQSGGASLAAQQAALQVTGNNISNAGTAGYTRQVAVLGENDPTQVGNGQYTGSGSGLMSVQRQVNAALNDSLRGATSDQSGAQTSNSVLTQLQTTFGALNDNDLSAQMTSFFNSFSTLANNPTDAGQRAVVIQNGVALAGYLNGLQTQVAGIQNNVNAQIATGATQADGLVKQIADLNKQIASSGGAASTLMDERDQVLTQLSQVMNIQVIDQGGGNLNVLVGGQPIVEGTMTRGVKSSTTTDASGNLTTQVEFGDNGDSIPVTGGSLGALASAQSQYVEPALAKVNSMAAGLIQAVNGIHTQGQGTAGFSSVTSTNSVSDPTAALNGGTPPLAFPPTNGTFDLYVTDASGTVSTKQISVNLSGTGTQTSMNSLAASVTAAGGGAITASVDATGHLKIASNDGTSTFGFGNDTSGVLAATGINTFFSGSNAGSIAVNSTLTQNAALLATGQDNTAGSNRNALAMALAGGTGVSTLGGQSVSDTYTGYITDLATKAQAAGNDVTATGTIHDTLFAQQQAISGVSLDEEAINLTQYQRAFQGTARFISVVDQMMQTVLGLIT